MQVSGYTRFKIDSKPAPNAYPIPNKFDVSARKLRLAGMLVHEALKYKLNREVVLSRPCIYGVFGGRFGGFKPLKQKCVGCMRCVQEYPHIMTVKPSKAYLKLGDRYWTPENVFTIWNEASTGKIPVKGMGYKGAFGGEGWDGIWTDMSEIVRPTRDGVYGREYISTSVDIGRKPWFVDFKRLEEGLGSLSVPVPVIFDEPPAGAYSDEVLDAIGAASKKIGTYYLARTVRTHRPVAGACWSIVDLLEGVLDVSSERKAVEFEADVPHLFDAIMRRLPRTILIGRLRLDENAAETACNLARRGVHGLHLYADYHGMDYSQKPRHISVALKEVHQRLVQEGLRDQVTLIASGGIILAEHVPKAIICGADLVAIDTTALVALQAEFLGSSKSRKECWLRPRKIDPVWGSQRLENLISVWHDQLIEILSAMGMRDVRRLRGDIGRSMMDSELREQSFKGI
ncbi:MAG TPA: glutamate synthase-related protein, partial [Candidatus Bathyarchaeia archaeon]|nr:glutamate synthase-related protein [Candidatus Bathyarchaeia archaeon]